MEILGGFLNNLAWALVGLLVAFSLRVGGNLGKAKQRIKELEERIKELEDRARMADRPKGQGKA